MSMKAPVLGLSIAAAAFAGSSLYLWQQLELERERSAQVSESTRQLNARIAELEATRQQFMHVRNSNGSVVTGAFGVGPAPSGDAKAAATNAASAQAEAAWIPPPTRERPAAMDKMLRWQVRADNKRMYADVGTALGLNKEKSAQLIDLLTEQQLAQFGSYADSPWSNDPAEARRKLEETQRTNDAAIEELLGTEKAQSLKEYQQSLPARQEFELLVNQLEGNDVTLTPEQHRKLLAAYIEERKRVPMPTFEGNTTRDPAAYHQAYTQWQNDYSERLANEARNILDSSQLNAFNEVQEWQREMRSEFQAITFTSAPAAGLALPAGATLSVAGGAVAVAAPATSGPPPRERKP
jgi:hypothetical protein